MRIHINHITLRYAGRVAMILFSVVFVIWEWRDLQGSFPTNGQLDDALLLYYLRFLFVALAIPMMWLAKIFVFFEFIREDDHAYYQIKLFNDTVYVVLVIYGLGMVINRLVS